MLRYAVDLLVWHLNSFLDYRCCINSTRIELFLHLVWVTEVLWTAIMESMLYGLIKSTVIPGVIIHTDIAFLIWTCVFIMNRFHQNGSRLSPSTRYIHPSVHSAIWSSTCPRRDDDVGWQWRQCPHLPGQSPATVSSDISPPTVWFGIPNGTCNLPSHLWHLFKCPYIVHSVTGGIPITACRDWEPMWWEDATRMTTRGFRSDEAIITSRRNSRLV